MNEEHALEIVRMLADGLDPFTDRELPLDGPYQKPQTVRALGWAVRALEEHAVRTRRQNQLPEHAGRPWSDEEDRQLIARFKAGESAEKMAEQHKRTEHAVRLRLTKLGQL